jgi:hypothetical protein
MEAAHGAGEGCASGVLTVWSPRGGHARGVGAARLAHMLEWTRCPENSGVSTVRVVGMHLMRWRWRGLTRAAARHAGVEWRRRGDVPRWRRCSDHGGAGGRILQHWRRGDKVRRTPLMSHDARRTRLTEGEEGGP